jgi:hypothetical protein
MVLQTGLCGSFIGSVPSLCLRHKFVRQSQKNAFLRAIRLWLFKVPQ